jgi:LacI family transcriptional regulator
MGFRLKVLLFVFNASSRGFSMAQSNSGVTLADVAIVAGVSKMTVSNVINGKNGMSEQTRQRVLRAIAQSGYVANSAARVLAGRSMNLLGVILPQFNSLYLNEILLGASIAAEKNGFDLAVFTTSSNIKRERERATLLRSLADGVLLLMPVAIEHQIFMNSIPVVTINADGPYTIQADNKHGGQLAAKHLLELGHTRIAHIHFPTHTINPKEDTVYIPREDALERQQGFLETLRMAGIDTPSEYLVDCNSVNFWVETSAQEAALQLLSLSDPPTAIFAASDEMAIGVLQAAQIMGLRVPEDLSVIGFDDAPRSANTNPPLTTVRQPLREMGAAAAQLLSKLARGETPNEPHPCFATELIVRDSTTTPK